MGRRKGKSKQAKKAQKGNTHEKGIEEEYKKVPHSFVFRRGKPIGKFADELISDIKRVMSPYTAKSLKPTKKNTLRDLTDGALVLFVEHLIIVSKSELNMALKICRPTGPTLEFRVMNYTLARDVVAAQKRPHMDDKQFQHPALLQMDGFSGEAKHIEFMAKMIKPMFPAIPNTATTDHVKRTVLFTYNPETDLVEFSHYNIHKARRPAGAPRPLKKILGPDVPNLGKYKNFSEFFTNGGDMSESEGELEGDHTPFPEIDETISLSEIGPRMTLKLIKVQEGCCDGKVIYHSLYAKTPEEIQAIEAKHKDRKTQKQQRKQQQEANIQRKEQEKEKNKAKSLVGMKRKAAEEEGAEAPETAKDDSDIDDSEYYRQELNEDPDPEMFPKRAVRLERLSGSGKQPPSKKQKMDDTHKDGKPFKKRDDNKKDSNDKFSKKKEEKKPLTALDKIKRRKARQSGDVKRPKRGPKMSKKGEKPKGQQGENDTDKDFGKQKYGGRKIKGGKVGMSKGGKGGMSKGGKAGGKSKGGKGGKSGGMKGNKRR